MLGGLGTLYAAYGGIWTLFKSPYLWSAAFLSASLVYISADVVWPELATSTIPSLTGFTIAAFAIFFSILTDKQRDALLKPKKSKTAPLVQLLSTVVHAMIVQVTALVSAGLATALKKSSLQEMIVDSCIATEVVGATTSTILPFLGNFLVFYSWLLMIAIALNVFSLLERVSKVVAASSTPPSPEEP